MPAIPLFTAIFLAAAACVVPFWVALAAFRAASDAVAMTALAFGLIAQIGILLAFAWVVGGGVAAGQREDGQ